MAVGSHAKARRREGREEERGVFGFGSCVGVRVLGGGEFFGLVLTRRREDAKEEEGLVWVLGVGGGEFFGLGLTRRREGRGRGRGRERGGWVYGLFWFMRRREDWVSLWFLTIRLQPSLKVDAPKLMSSPSGRSSNRR